ncbi:type IV pilus assembly protein PilC [Jatrophihabitans endophyticus]|uniref:Type IV pilus assembly protein PilC n=1 Tax=Jatrophihabitans endophyticus TaxID=1206085 RepID=A0A1M5UFW2_9ACTN|nr:type II secretion system F family protein [Jatrophihabitans endophyticus]SHH61810.1 type IV pilus assembly protein PilC [Jatrophihabitans endophyticus]
MSAPAKAKTKASKDRTFAYEAVDLKGKRSKGTVEARDESGVAAALKSQGVTALFIQETGKGLQREITLPGFGPKVGLKDLAVFSRQFATMATSGLSLLRSLTILEDQTENQVLAKAVRDVRRDIETGQSLSGALGKHDIFPPIMVAMIRAGETGGFLDKALERLAQNFEKDANLRAKIKSAMTYPVIVICFSLLMITGVLIFIVPVFEHMFANLGGKLPLPTQIMVTLSHNALWILPVTAVLAFAAVKGIRSKLKQDPAWRLRFDALKLRVPVFGTLFTKIAISRFARNLGTLLSVGVPVMQALEVVGGTTGNAVIGDAMKDVANSVKQGQPMSAPLGDHPVFPQMVVQMIEVGEETGQISAMLDKISDFYDHEVETATESLTAAIEPLMVVVMGALIGVMVICLYLPMFSIYQNIGNQ